jgi:hypothetical protein
MTCPTANGRKELALTQTWRLCDLYRGAGGDESKSRGGTNDKLCPECVAYEGDHRVFELRWKLPRSDGML